MAITKVSPGLLDLDSGITISVADNSDNLTLTSTDADANSGPNLRMYRNSSSPADNDYIGEIQFEGRNDNSQDVVYAGFQGRVLDASDGTEDGRFELYTIRNGAQTSMMMTSASEIIFNNDSIDLDFRVESDDNANMLFVDGGNDRVAIGTSSPSTKLHVLGDSSDGGIYVKQGAQIAYTPSDQANFQQGITFANASSGHAYSIGYGQGGSLKFSYYDNASTYTELANIGGTDKDLTIGGNLILADGKGISFAATANSSGSMSSEVLDDYEEGTATLTLSATTTAPTINEGNTFTINYTKIGNLVRFVGYTSVRNITNAGTGIVKVTGLPFAQAGSYYGHVTFTHTTMFSGDAPVGYIENGNTYFYPVLMSSTSGVSYSTGQKYMMCQGVYHTA
jgi:hypothetical protein|tara:strand:+ start:749 stop:1930 length:1182 start_codon:yes stop_codon:yes gene_type:complete